MIAFVGSVFSPRYYRDRQRAAKHNKLLNPEGYCAFNLSIKALTSEGIRRLGQKEVWCFNEYRDQAVTSVSDPIAQVNRTASSFRLGHTVLHQSKDLLQAQLNERTAPFFQRMTREVIGEISLFPSHRHGYTVPLDTHGLHRWFGLAPLSRIHVKLTSPAVEFKGSAYHDGNAGLTPLEDVFTSWTWRREETHQGTAVLYDLHERTGATSNNAFLFLPNGEVIDYQAPVTQPLSSGLWRVSRSTRVPEGGNATLCAPLIDSPFYTRDVLTISSDDQQTTSIHEALDLNRLRQGWVRFLMGFRLRMK